MNTNSRNIMNGVGVKLLCLAIILSIASTLRAQSFYGSIVGTVTDPTGAVVPAASITVTNVGTNEKQTAKADSSGKFNFVNVLPATYKVDIEKAGFKRFQRDQLTVEVGAVARADAQMQVGAISETVEVSTAAALLQTDSSSLVQQISGQQVQEMPLNGRNVENLIALAPGVVPTGSSQGDTGLNQGTRTAGGAGYNNYQIGGAIQGQSIQYIDGVPNNVLNGNTIALVPTQDSIQEFSVASSNAPAEFGRFAGGVVNFTTKSGANKFHGTGYEYLRNAAFNANDFFSNRAHLQRPKYNQNQYGVEVTGPIKRDKAFFLFTWEGFAGLFGNLTPTNVPTSAASASKFGGSDMQDGVIPEVYSATGALLNPTIVDPLGNCNIVHNTGTAAAPGNFTITNLYVGNCGDPLNKILKGYFPDPLQNPLTSTSNYQNTTPLNNHQNQYNGRVDYNLSAKQRLFGRYTYWAVHDTGHTEFNDKGQGGVSFPTADGHNALFVHQFVAGDTYTVNPTTVLDVRLNYVRETDPNSPDSLSVNEGQFGTAYSALASQMLIHVLPAFNASGGVHSLYNLGNFPNYSINWWNTYGINANLVKILGAHTLKFGTELRLMDQSGIGNLASGSGGYTYSTTFTGDEWASFLLGYPTQINFNTAASTAAYMHYQGYYVTDTWQATRNLTLNLGLRYELPGAIAERNDKATVLLPNAVDPYTGITGTLSLVNSALYGGRSTVIPEHNLFAPRVGFAYRLSPNTVLQGGYGISYLPNDLTGGTIPANSLVNAATTQVNIVGTPTPLQTALAGIAAKGLNQPIGRSLPSFMTLYGSKSSYLGKVISGPVPNQPYPYVQQYNVGLSHQFKGDWMVGVAYSGLKGTNLPGSGNRGLDQLSSQYYGMGAGLLANAPCANANGLTLSVGQCLRPYPYYNNVQDTAEFYARENYRSLQIKTEKRFGRSGVLGANFTTSKNMANTDTQNGFLESKSTTQGGSGNGGIQDWNNLQNEYSLISFDVTNRAVINYVLNLPFGHGQRYASNFTGPLDALASGWTVTGISILQSGFPIFFSTATSSKIQSNFGGGTTRPNVVAGCNKKIAGSGLARVNAGGWFNTSCFAYAGDYALGNEPRVDPDLRGDGIKNFDFSFQKSTHIRESANLEFRTEFFNVFNRVQFAPPGNTVGSGTFGQVSYQVNKPRQIQVSLRLNY